MTDTTEPPKRRAAPGGDRPRARSSGGERLPGRPTGGDRPSGSDKQRRAEPPPTADDSRIAKVMARAGLCSRRDAETWIAAGRVAVNGRTIDSPALNVGAQDKITVDGVALPEREPTRLFLFHKPRGLVTTARDPEGRPTIFENLPEGLPRVVSVGRLDINTEGLMLLTNDGGLARVLELPATGWLRRYRVRANGTVDQAQLDALKEGVTLDGVDYAGIEAMLDRQQGANVWLTMGLREGKNREIKRVLESLGLAVTRLIRVSFGPFQLGELVAGAAESVPTRILREQLGPDLAAKAGVSFPDATSRPPATIRQEARSRAHVTALRSAREEAADGPRRRIERAATADRKGRAVEVERVVPVGGMASRDGALPSRNARRFAAETRDAAPPRRAARERTEATERPRRDTAVRFREQSRDDSRRESGERPQTARPNSFKDAPRGERADRQESFGTATRRPREGGFEERPRRDKPASPFRERTRDERGSERADRPRAARQSSFKDAPRGERADRQDTVGTATRRPREGGFKERPRRDKAPSSSGGRTRDERGSEPNERPRATRPRGSDDAARGERPTGGAGKSRGFSGKPGGRAGGFGSERPATGRNRPETFADRGGDRPARGASKPGGFKSSGRSAGGDRPQGGDRPARGGKPSGGKPSGGKPSGSRPSGGRPPRGRP